MGLAMRKVAVAASILAMLATPSSGFAAFDPNRIVDAVDYVGKTFSCHAQSGGSSYTYKTTDRTVFRINGKRVRLSYIWNKGSFSEIKVRQIVTVQYHLRGEDRIADRVAIYPKK